MPQKPGKRQPAIRLHHLRFGPAAEHHDLAPRRLPAPSPHCPAPTRPRPAPPRAAPAARQNRSDQPHVPETPAAGLRRNGGIHQTPAPSCPVASTTFRANRIAPLVKRNRQQSARRRTDIDNLGLVPHRHADRVAHPVQIGCPILPSDQLPAPARPPPHTGLHATPGIPGLADRDRGRCNPSATAACAYARKSARGLPAHGPPGPRPGCC